MHFFFFQQIFWNTWFFAIDFINSQLLLQKSPILFIFHHWLLKNEIYSWLIFWNAYFFVFGCVSMQLFSQKSVKFIPFHDWHNILSGDFSFELFIPQISIYFAKLSKPACFFKPFSWITGFAVAYFQHSKHFHCQFLKYESCYETLPK